MLAKYITVIVLGLVIGISLLDLRQQRIDAMHDMAEMHGQMNHTRQAVWNYQATIAAQIQPKPLQQAVERAGLALEPITPAPEPEPITGRLRGVGALEPMDSH